MNSIGQIQVELQDFMGNDRSIAEAAWTSSLDYQKKEARSDQDVARVIKMLAELKHSVPFESVVLRFWIKLPIQTDRQFMTHRIQSASGMSGRYRTMPEEYLAIPGDVSTILFKALDPISADHYEFLYEDQCSKNNKIYRQLLNDLKEAEKKELITNTEYKRVREFYRGMLPQNAMTERVSIMNLRAFSNFMKLRLDKHAQLEIQDVARLMLQEVKDKGVAPIAVEWLEKNNWSL